MLAVSWNRHNGVIVSGGEDCRYKLWDSSGNLLFSSGAVEYPITAVNWCPNGMYFVAGFCNTIKLCDVAGVAIIHRKIITVYTWNIIFSHNIIFIVQFSSGFIHCKKLMQAIYIAWLGLMMVHN